MSDFVPSGYQTAIFDWIENGAGNASVNAVAGSGKTTTLLKGIKRARGNGYMTAFSKKIAEELQDRLFEDLVQNARAGTIHALGKATLHRLVGDSQVVTWKAQRTIEAVLAGEEDDSLLLRSELRQVASKVKTSMTDPGDEEAVQELIEYHSLDVPEERMEPLLKFLPKVLKAMQDNVREHDFDDMIWLPYVLGGAPSPYDWLFVDEVQDLNILDRSFLLRGRIGRVLSVGDPYQSIFGFKGADTESMDQFARLTNAVSLPLSICYRCPSSHVALAKRIVQQIEPRPNATRGIVGSIQKVDLFDRAEEGDVILCRTNAPLTSLAMDFLKRGKKVTILGKRDIGEGLKSLIDKQHAGTLEECLRRLLDYRDRECAKLIVRQKQAQAELLGDKVEAIEILSEGSRTIHDLKRKIDTIFSDELGDGVILSTVHKAKGLEFENVFIHRPDLIPFPFAKKDWERQQEMNLKYVALTRSKHGLFIVHSEEMRRDESNDLLKL